MNDRFQVHKGCYYHPWCLKHRFAPVYVESYFLYCFAAFCSVQLTRTESVYGTHSQALDPLLIPISLMKINKAKDTGCHVNCNLNGDKRSTQVLWWDFPDKLLQTFMVVLRRTSDTSLQESIFGQIFIDRLYDRQNILGMYVCLNEFNALAAAAHSHHEFARCRSFFMLWIFVSRTVMKDRCQITYFPRNQYNV